MHNPIFRFLFLLLVVTLCVPKEATTTFVVDIRHGKASRCLAAGACSFQAFFFSHAMGALPTYIFARLILNFSLASLVRASTTACMDAPVIESKTAVCCDVNILQGKILSSAIARSPSWVAVVCMCHYCFLRLQGRHSGCDGRNFVQQRRLQPRSFVFRHGPGSFPHRQLLSVRAYFLLYIRICGVQISFEVLSLPARPVCSDGLRNLGEVDGILLYDVFFFYNRL